MDTFKELLEDTEAHRRNLEDGIAARLSDKWTDYDDEDDSKDHDLGDEDTELDEDQIRSVLEKAKQLLLEGVNISG